MRFIISPRKEGKNADKGSALEALLKSQKSKLEIKVSADDRWGAVIEAYKEWKISNFKGMKMQDLFDAVYVRKETKRYVEGWMK